MVKDMSTKPHGFVLILLKNYILHFCKNAEGLGETKGQHICSANVSHKWLPASLCGVGCPKFNPQSEFISDEEKREFQGFKPMGLLLYTSVYSSKS